MEYIYIIKLIKSITENVKVNLTTRDHSLRPTCRSIYRFWHTSVCTGVCTVKSTRLKWLYAVHATPSTSACYETRYYKLKREICTRCEETFCTCKSHLLNSFLRRILNFAIFVRTCYAFKESLECFAEYFWSNFCFNLKVYR